MGKPGDFTIHREVFPSGLRAIVVPMEGTRAVSFMALIGTGARHEKKSEWGISHFLEHMFFKGSKKRPTTRLISETLDRTGGEFNAFTSKELTVLYAKAAGFHTRLIVDVIGDMLMRPLLDTKEIVRERGVITEEINMYEDMPIEWIVEEWESLLFTPHSLGKQTIGTKETISSFSKRDFLEYFRRRYTAQNIVVCLAGDVDPGEGMNILKKQFSRLRSKKKHTPTKSFNSSWGKHRVSVREKQTDQAHIIIGGTGVSLDHNDRTASDVLAAILGGSMSSRLFIEVRERRGLAYAVRTASEHFTDTGYIATQAGVDPEKLVPAVRIIAREYDRISTRAVPKTELLKAKESIKGRILLRLEAADAVAQFVGSQELLSSSIRNLSKVISNIENVTQDDIMRVAQQHLARKRLRITAVTPREKEQEQLSKLIA